VDGALEPPLPDSQEAVEAAVSQLASDPHAGDAAEVLLRLLQNVVANPGDPKFRSLRLSNTKIQVGITLGHILGRITRVLQQDWLCLLTLPALKLAFRH
jgi:hypothetical protein